MKSQVSIFLNLVCLKEILKILVKIDDFIDFKCVIVHRMQEKYGINATFRDF